MSNVRRVHPQGLMMPRNVQQRVTTARVHLMLVESQHTTARSPPIDARVRMRHVRIYIGMHRVDR